MALIICDTPTITQPDSCADRGGIRALYWTEYANINFDAMLADPLQFDDTNHLILDYTMNGGAVFNKVEFEKEQAFYEFTYTEDTDVYENLITLGFRGKDNALKVALQQAIQCCNIYVHLYAFNGHQRTVGVEYNGEVFDSLVRQQRITRHVDRSGQLSTSKAGDELDLGSRSFFAPLFATVTETDIPLV